MVGIDDILGISTPEQFEGMAMKVFRFQAEYCDTYRRYMELIGVNRDQVSETDSIPFLPIELFKTSEVYCGPTPPEKIFTSSTTGGGEPSKHPVRALSDYEKTFSKAFSLFYGDPAHVRIYALLPGYLEREGSSLIYMIDRLISKGGGGFYLRDTDKMLRDMERVPGQKILLGVTYALLDLAEKNPDLHGVAVMETGGMKGKREEMPKKELHHILCDSFNVGAIHSEYGMAELMSQAYSCGHGIFRTPPWMRVKARDINAPFDTLPPGSAGGINIIDLANIWSCAFIQTQDIGTVFTDGSFTVAGRIDRSETRGCNLLVQ